MSKGITSISVTKSKEVAPLKENEDKVRKAETNTKEVAPLNKNEKITRDNLVYNRERGVWVIGKKETKPELSKLIEDFEKRAGIKLLRKPKGLTYDKKKGAWIVEGGYSKIEPVKESETESPKEVEVQEK